MRARLSVAFMMSAALLAAATARRRGSRRAITTLARPLPSTQVSRSMPTPARPSPTGDQLSMQGVRRTLGRWRMLDSTRALRPMPVRCALPLRRSTTSAIRAI